MTGPVAHPYQHPYPHPYPSYRNGLGTAALIVAIGGLVVCWSVVGGVVAGVVAIVLGAIGRGRAKRGEANNGGVAIAGIALGLLAVVVSLVFAAIWFVAWRDTGGVDYMDCVVRAGGDQRAVDNCVSTWMTGVEKKFSLSPSPTRGSI